MARKTRTRNRKLTPLSNNPYDIRRRRRSSRRRSILNDTELNVKNAIRHKSPILRATKDTTFNDKIVSVIKKKTQLPYINILEKLQPDNCKKRRSFKKVMMRKLAAQVKVAAGAGAVFRWRDKLTRQERYTKC